MRVGDIHIHYEQCGEGGETILFSHGLLWSCRMFDPQVEVLRDSYRCVAYDHRGQGLSEVPDVRSIGIDTCYEDAVALIEKLELGPVHFVGLSMGGYVGLRIAIRRPDLLRSLVLMETDAQPEDPRKVRSYRMMNLAARWMGLRFVADRVMPIMFGQTFLNDPAREADRAEWKGRLLQNKRSIHRAVRGVVERAGVADQLDGITVPTLIVVGEEDVATPPERAEALHAGIAGSRLVRIPGAGHTSTVEAPEAVTAALQEFWAAL